MSESKEQQLVVRWFRTQYPDKIIFAIPNDLKMSYKAKNPFAFKAQMKKEGVLPGVSDLFVAVPTFLNCHFQYCGLFLEMKDKGKTQCSVSDKQKQFLEDMYKAGYCARWAAGFDEAKQIIEDYLNGNI